MKLSSTQQRALEEVAAGRVRGEPDAYRRYYSTVFPPAVRSGVVLRLVEKGLVYGVYSGVFLDGYYRMLLTDAGREALAEARDVTRSRGS